MNTFDVRAEFQGAYTQRRTRTDYIVVHHAADHYGALRGIDDVRAIKRWHTNAPPNGRGWPGIAYHRVLAEEYQLGPIAHYICSDPDTLRYHVAGQNERCVGVCCATDFGNSLPEQKWIDALAAVLVDLKRRYPTAQIVGHRDIALPGYETSCPGGRWAAWKPGLLAQVESRLDVWAAWGMAYPLPEAQRGWGIPQLWRENTWLGPATSYEIFPDEDTSIRTFRSGYIVYEKLANAAKVYRRVKELS